MLHQADAAIVPAARGTRGACRTTPAPTAPTCATHSPVTAVRDLGAGGLEVRRRRATSTAGGLVVCADAWTNDVLAGLGVAGAAEVTLEQVTYFAPERPDDFAPGRLPLWIWMDDPCYYGFPTYGEPTVKAAQDCGGPVVDPESRTFDPDPAMAGRLAAFMARCCPAAAGRCGRCAACTR